MKMVYSNFGQHRLRSYFNCKMVNLILVLHIKNTNPMINIRIITSPHKTKHGAYK
jgi:hypothetical protein